ncbi:MAG: hypothetical protein KDD61_12070 [Bdellovibrionales bacterium]|nr:hypothetical protein [Bdellovibrionales bacterium]
MLRNRSLYLLAIALFGVQPRCSQVAFNQDQASETKQGTPTQEVPFCFATQTVGTCKVFEDSFERDLIVEQEDFRWQKVIVDSGQNVRNIDANILWAEEFGYVPDQERALLFHGREGGSTHEIFLVSKELDIDVQQFDKVEIRLSYLPIKLEQKITLSSGYKVPESVRVDVCHESDLDCGLTGNDSQKTQGIRSRESWDDYWFDLHYGLDNQLGLATAESWIDVKVTIDLDRYRQRGNFVFKITVSMDEGYIGNDHSKPMEDGLAIDHLVVTAIKD